MALKEAMGRLEEVEKIDIFTQETPQNKNKNKNPNGIIFLVNEKNCKIDS